MKLRFFFLSVLRDIRSRKSSALQIVLAIAIGTGSVTAIHAYREELSRSILKEARNLMGADLLVQSSSPFTKEQREFMSRSLPSGSETSELVQFASMLRNPENDETSLSLIKTMKGKFPYYGEIVTEPPGIYRGLKDGEILLEESLILNLKLKIGASVVLGEREFVLKGKVLKEPGIAGNFLSMAPTSIISGVSLASTGLEQRGSRISYLVPVKLKDPSVSGKYKEESFKEYIQKDLTLYDSTETNSGSRKFLTNTLDFFSLLGLSAFFLGGISILLASRAGIREKSGTLAVLKCLGASPNTVSLIVLGELFFFSAIGSVLGILLGALLLGWIPDLAGEDILSFRPSIGASSFFWGILIGVLVPFFSSIESLVEIRTLKPILAVKNEFQEETNRIFRFKISQVFAYSILFGLFFLLAWWETESPLKGALLCSILLGLPLIVFFVYSGIRIFLSGLRDRGDLSPFLRFVLGKFDRPGTTLSLSVIGLTSSLFILLLSLIVSESLLEYSGSKDKERRPNVFVLDIRAEQKEHFEEVAKDFGAERMIVAPVIGARLAKINGEPVKKEETDSSAFRRDWRSTARTREYFLSYRNEPYPTEKIVDGDFWRKGEEDQISIEKEFSTHLKVQLGDSLTFSIGGVEVTGIIRNFRAVNWSDMRPNFVVLFSKGILEKAPGYYLSSLRIESESKRYELQKSLVSKYPNLTIIDTDKAVRSFLGILEKISFTIRLMTWLILGASLLLVLTALNSSRKERIEETTLLRIIGGTSGFLKRIFLWEGILLGTFSYLLALVLACVANELISAQILEIQPSHPIFEYGIVYLFTIVATSTVYYFNLQGEWKKPPVSFMKSM
ncbi:FtsX-like permease family protein [Leptospira gomenensis]|uniref:FtsX-like permease family protein n=2 Tax=Leptospira gomenensis TaxID=2484974 RepID=A0A5F1Y9Z8_9LEPT|nr:FtsX-like permease family protein [Leptospira gomenensis]TGK32656.1 FtsX-like permease family protein [Leptospira gomenensis]TGK36804.1 FtsX-like permease family protein [Leptospira gomenensis]TGK65319.1 FtsX-like permease family protein [Leptospira gomenensis]